MSTLLAIGSDGPWLQEFSRSAAVAGYSLVLRGGLFDAWMSKGAITPPLAGVLVDADAFDERINPALLALRWRYAARFVVIHGARSEPVARRLHGDVVLAKAAGVDAVLAAFASAPGRRLPWPRPRD